MHNAGGELRRIPILGTGVKIALAAAPFSWLRGGPPRVMGHLGEERQEKNRKGGGLASPITSAQALFLAVHSPTRLAVTCGSNPAATNSGSVRTNANLEPSGAMKMSPCTAAPSLTVRVPVQFALTVYVPLKRSL
jgi:hypothetical protein